MSACGHLVLHVCKADIVYTLRTRQHNKNLIPKTSDLNDRHFLIRLVYKDAILVYFSLA